MLFYNLQKHWKNRFPAASLAPLRQIGTLPKFCFFIETEFKDPDFQLQVKGMWAPILSKWCTCWNVFLFLMWKGKTNGFLETHNASCMNWGFFAQLVMGSCSAESFNFLLRQRQNAELFFCSNWLQDIKRKPCHFGANFYIVQPFFCNHGHTSYLIFIVASIFSFRMKKVTLSCVFFSFWVKRVTNWKSWNVTVQLFLRLLANQCKYIQLLFHFVVVFFVRTF